MGYAARVDHFNSTLANAYMAMISCAPLTTGQDLWHITQVLAGVPNWQGLADLLDIVSDDIKTNCAQNDARAECYRRALVRRYCDSQQNSNTSEVVENIAEALEQMDHKRQAKELRDKFGKSVAKVK